MKTKQKIKIIVAAGFMLAVMIIIFIFSGQKGSASSNASNSVGELVLGILGIEIPEGHSASSVVIFAGLTIRNLAHIFLYALLGVASFLFVLSLFMLKIENSKFVVIYISLSAIGISFLYACLDEFHQMFVDGRASTFRDVGYDSIGFITTILISALITYLVFLKKSKSV